MKTVTETHPKKNSKVKSFGVSFSCDKVSRQDFMELAAKLFLNPQVSPRHALYYIGQILNDSLPVSRLLEMADKGVSDLLFKKAMGVDISEILCEKVEDWISYFDMPTSADWNYLIRHYGISRDDLLPSLSPLEVLDFHSAKDMANHVKQYVKCQDTAVETFSVPIFQQNESKKKQLEYRIATPVVLIGRTGSGKSEMCHQFQRISDCPVIYVNTSEIVPTAWRGMHLTDVFMRAIKDGCSIEELKYAIVVLDEFDKAVHFKKKKVGDGTDFDADMMRDIMRLFDAGHDLFLEDGLDKDFSTKGYRLPTDNMLVVFAGAFSGIEDVVKKRLHLDKSIGFSQTSKSPIRTDDLLKQVSTEDLVEWGFMPELIGRIGDICVLNSLTSEMIFEIMTNAKDNVVQAHIDYCRQYNIELRFTTEALHLIADAAYESGLGFRNVNTLFSKCLRPMYYELSDEPKAWDKRIVEIDTKYVLNQLTR